MPTPDLYDLSNPIKTGFDTDKYLGVHKYDEAAPDDTIVIHEVLNQHDAYMPKKVWDEYAAEHQLDPRQDNFFHADPNEFHRPRLG